MTDRGFRTELIIIIDDDLEYVKGLHSHLSGKRMRVVATKSPRRGVDLALTFNPDLILLGLQIGQTDGRTVLQELRSDEITKDIPTVMIVSTSGTEGELQVGELGVVDFLMKPCTTVNLLNKIDDGLAIARELNVQRAFRKPEPVRLTHSANIIRISFPDGLGHSALQGIRSVITPRFARGMEEGIVIFDLRNLPDITHEQAVRFKTILELTEKLITITIAGRNYGLLLTEDLEERTNLFMSEEELRAYLTLIGRKI